MSQDPDPTTDVPTEVNGEDPEEEPDLDGEESFPASDPPAHWQGDDNG